jgi:hypothetical protein
VAIVGSSSCSFPIPLLPALYELLSQIGCNMKFKGCFCCLSSYAFCFLYITLLSSSPWSSLPSLQLFYFLLPGATYRHAFVYEGGSLTLCADCTFLRKQLKVGIFRHPTQLTIPTERPALVSEVSANFLWIYGAVWSAWRILTAVMSVF